MDINLFNIRIYGLLVKDGDILVTDEYRLGIFMTKFPGGALEFGEGTIQCLEREFMEETGMKIRVLSHFYTTDYFQPTALLPRAMQLINIYYIVETDDLDKLKTSEKKFDFAKTEEGAQSFRWIPVSALTAGDLTLPVDQHIVPMIKEYFLKTR